MVWTTVKDELDWDDVGGRLLANLAKGIYSHEAVLREYVQNAADAYKKLGTPSSEHKITIAPDGNDLSIQDEGIGMDEHDIKAAKKIAVSTKAEQEDMTGFRGIGIWAGFQACDKLIVDSTKLGSELRFRLTIDFDDILKHVDENINIKQLVDPRYKIQKDKANKDEHFTRVTLVNMHADYKQLLEENELIRIGATILPARVDPKFQYADELNKILETWPLYEEYPICVRTVAGTTDVFRRFPANAMEPPTEIVLKSEDGVELGRVWRCRSKDAALRNVQQPAFRRAIAC